MRLYGIEDRSIWMDEDAQVRRVVAGGFDLGLIDRAATQQQPPIDYYLQYIGIQLFGVTPLGARFHAALLSAATVLLMFLLLRRMLSTWLTVLVGTTLCLLHHTLIFYAHEARPISCGIFFATLQLFVLHAFMLGRRPGWQRALWGGGLTASSAAFLLSVGFQPMILLAVSSAALTPGLAVRSLRLRVLAAWALIACGVLGALPLLARVLAQGSRFLQGARPPVEQLQAVAEQALRPEFASWTDKFSELLTPLWPLTLLAAASGLVGLVLDFKAGGGNESEARPSLVSPDERFSLIFLLGVSGLFPWVFDSTFEAIVDYQIKERYYACYIPVLLLTVACLLHFGLRWFDRIRQMRPGGGPLLGFILGSVLVATLALQGNAAAIAYQEPRRDWASLYALFREAPGRGVAYMVHLVGPKEKRANYYAQRFYYTRLQPRPVALRKQEHIARDCTNHRGFLLRPNLYIVVRYDSRKLVRIRKKLEKALPTATFHPFHGTSVLQLQAPEGQSRQALERAFEALVRHLPKSQDNYRAYTILAELQLCNRRPRAARRTINQLKSLDSRALRRTIESFERRIERDLRTRRKRDRSAGG